MNTYKTKSAWGAAWGLSLMVGALCTPSQAKSVTYHVYTSYFESNQSGLTGPNSFLAFSEQAPFDQVFGAAAVMGNNSFLPDNAFNSNDVVAVIKRGHNTWSYTVQSLKSSHGKLTVRYKATPSQTSPSATFASPLIIAVSKKFSGPVVFIENGKKVGTALLK